MVALPLVYLYKYKRLRNLIIKVIKLKANANCYSLTVREIFKKYHKVTVGLYSYGECFIPGSFDPNTAVGRFCSIATGVRVMNRNHSVAEFSTHPFFFNRKTGFVPVDTIEFLQKTIGNDVWIGINALILPRVRSIGNGAVIGAGSIVVSDVPDFAIVTGNPAVVKKYRFSQDGIEYLNDVRWWEYDISALMEKKDEIAATLSSIEHSAKRKKVD